MLSDKDILPLCKKWASRFVDRAAHLGSPEDAFNELVNVAYCTAKPLSKLRGASSWIMWELVRYINTPSVERFKRGSFRISDLRKSQEKFVLTPFQIAEMKDRQRSMIKAVTLLESEEIAIIKLYYAQSKTYKEIGEIFGCSGWWISKRMKKILKKLREFMEE